MTASAAGRRQHRHGGHGRARDHVTPSHVGHGEDPEGEREQPEGQQHQAGVAGQVAGDGQVERAVVVQLVEVGSGHVELGHAGPAGVHGQLGASEVASLAFCRLLERWARGEAVPRLQQTDHEFLGIGVAHVGGVRGDLGLQHGRRQQRAQGLRALDHDRAPKGAVQVDQGLVARVRRRYRSTTMSEHDQPVAANILNREFRATAPTATELTCVPLT